jgi:paraquat-inducible protein B
MADRPETPELDDVPDAVVVPKRRWTLQWVWVLPIVAAVIGGWLAVRAVLADGPTITIRFKTAEGLEPGKTRIKYKDVEIGVVKRVSLADDRAGVVVEADMSKAAEELLVQDTRFWVVRARIAGGTVSGIGTLLSGTYVGMDPGKSKNSREDFVGLETPPVITTGLAGKQFALRADDIGSLDVGSPVYYRRLEAGRVIAYELDAQGTGVLVRIFVNAPYDRYVTANARFWHASGIDVTVDANGLNLNTESLASVLIGGLAFQVPDESPPQPPVAENAVFTLFADRTHAMKQPITVSERYASVFSETVRGLAAGSPVEFRGLVVGEVKSIAPRFDRGRGEFVTVVEFDFYPQRLFVEPAGTRGGPQDALSLSRLVDRGMRAQLRAANIITGQLFLALDFVPGVTKTSMDMTKLPPEVPVAPGGTQELQATIASIAKKLDRVPYEEIGLSLRRTLDMSTKTLERIDRELTPEAREALVEVRQAMVEARKALASVERTMASVEPLPLEASDAMREMSRAAQSFRALADYLERHPEAVIRGKREEAK